MTTQTHEGIREYYGRVLGTARDLKTSACCSTDSLPAPVREIAGLVASEVIEKFYGCGSPIPPALEGRTVVDLGCGTGRDAFICAKLAGEAGRVVGIDMTEEQLAVARRHEAATAARFGFARPNTSFRHGYMEHLAAAGIADSTVDVVISNCVLNLAPDKPRVFRETLRVLRPGGELLFSDVFADRRLPREWMHDQVLVGECLAGAMYLEDFRRMMLDLGVRDFRVVASRPIRLDNPEIEAKCGMVNFRSVTVRAFKLDSLEDRCEDYGQVATYLGTIAGAPHRFALDDHHDFEAYRPVLVCGNTASMLSETRLAQHFRVQGDRSRHFGLFPCGPASAANTESSGGACC